MGRWVSWVCGVKERVNCVGVEVPENCSTSRFGGGGERMGSRQNSGFGGWKLGYVCCGNS